MWDNHKLLRSLASLLFVCALGMVMYAGGFWLTHSLVFPVKKIQIHGPLARVTPEQLKFIAEHELSGTFFTLDIDKIRAAFGKLPWVKEAEIRRRWPDTLDIKVNEHKAVARWHENGLVGAEGEWFDAASDQVLPILNGPAGSQKEMGEMLLSIRDILVRAGLVPTKVHMSERRAWRVELNNGVWLELGRGNVEQRVTRFSSYWRGTLASLPYPIKYVDLRYPNGFAVRVSNSNRPALKKQL